MTTKKDNTILTEKLYFGLLLAFTGGFMDVYSYTVHGKVFATGQTGNLVLVAFNLANRDYAEMFHALVPIISFWLGIFVCWHMFYYFFKEKHLFWQRGTLISEIIILFITGLLPHSYPDIISNTLVSFAASLQFCCFRKLSIGAYANIFSTGNMRSCADNYYMGLIKKDKNSLNKALGYSSIVFAFFSGAIIGALDSKFFQEKAIWSVLIILFIVLSFLFKNNKTEIDTEVKEGI